MTNTELVACLLLLSLPWLSLGVALTGPRNGITSIARISSLLHLVALMIALWLLAGQGNASFVEEITWFKAGNVTLQAGIYLNSITRWMILAVVAVSTMVHVFSITYMADDARQRSYYAGLGLFTGAMLGLVVSSHLVQFFFFWELIGFSSYFLIGHYIHKSEAGSAATKAFLLNRIGDMGLLLGILMIWNDHRTLAFTALASVSLSPTASLLLFAGVIAKSAQLPLYTWLPDAMEGPTPVSALIHAATMVTAGVFLLVRVSPALPSFTLEVITLTGTLTALLGAWGASVQTDLKKIIAYSTISQLGLMVVGIGVGSADAAFTHLFTHAFFKAGLFLCAGAIAHALHHQAAAQDIRQLGGLRHSLKLPFLTCLMAGASLAGLPFTSGFLSKDLILIAAVQGSSSWILPAVLLCISMITVWYTVRLIHFLFLAPAKSDYSNTIPLPYSIRLPLWVLLLLSGWWIISNSPFSMNRFLATSSTDTHTFIVALTALLTLMAAGVSVLILRRKSLPHESIFSVKDNPIDLVFLASTRWTVQAGSWLSMVDTRIIDRSLHALVYSKVALAYVTAWFDRNLIDGTVNGIAWFAQGTGNAVRSLQAGKIQLYIFWSMVGLVIFLFFTLLS